MGAHAKIQLSRLREIGWSLWDPIGLRALGEDDWRDGGACADEYDSYLLQVTGMLRRAEPAAHAAAYLETVETERMGLTRNDTTRARAQATIAAIDAYLASLPAGPPGPA